MAISWIRQSFRGFDHLLTQPMVAVATRLADRPYCLHVTLRARLRPLALGLTPRAVLDKFATIQMLDVHFPTTDGRTLILSRYTYPETDHKLLLEQLNLTLPAQPPRISSRGKLLNHD